MTRRVRSRMVVVPQGGLGNRMRVIRSACSLAADVQCGVEVAFAENGECRCRFEDVFMPLDVAPGNFAIRRARWIDTPPSRANLHLPQMIRALNGTRQYCGVQNLDPCMLKSLSASEQRVYIATCYEFYESRLPMSRLFKPSVAVEEAMKPLLDRFGSRTVGFHIRATDNAEAVIHSPYSLFADAARRELDSDPATMLYVATDSDGIRRRFAGDFGGSVICSPAELSRSSLKGMVAAAADMFTLSHCCKIYGSHYSSFSEIAAELGGKQAEILKVS